MPQDPTVQVAVIGVLTTLITTGGVILAAIVNNRRERNGAAEAGVEETLRERILLRDEQIANRDLRISELMRDIDALREENNRLRSQGRNQQ